MFSDTSLLGQSVEKGHKQMVGFLLAKVAARPPTVQVLFNTRLLLSVILTLWKGNRLCIATLRAGLLGSHTTAGV